MDFGAKMCAKEQKKKKKKVRLHGMFSCFPVSEIHMIYLILLPASTSTLEGQKFKF